MKKILFLLFLLAPWLAQAGIPYVWNYGGISTNQTADLRNGQRFIFRGPNGGDDGYAFKWYSDRMVLTDAVSLVWLQFNHGIQGVQTGSTKWDIDTFTGDASFNGLVSAGNGLAGNGAGVSNLVGYLPLSGGTLTGAVYTTTQSSNAPAGTELVCANWVRSLFNNGLLYYASANIDAAATNSGTANQPVYTYQSVIPPSSSRSYTNPSAGTYMGSVMTTNTFTVIQGPVDVNGYIGLSSGGGDAMTLKAELYYSYDKTNWLGDYETSAQAITPGQTNLYQFVVTFPTITSTNAAGFYIERRYKVYTKGGSPTVTFLIGTNLVSGTGNASHIAFAGPSSALGNAFLANDQTFTGTNTFTKPIIGDGNSMTNLVATNVLSAGLSFSGPTNAITLLNDYQTYVASDNVGLTGVILNGRTWTTLVISNSLGTPITNFITDAAWRAQGTQTTNALNIASGKVGIVSVLVLCGTNYATCVQQ